MIIIWKLKVRDDYGVEALLNIEGFRQTEIEAIIEEFCLVCAEKEFKTDVGTFCSWFRRNHCTSNQKDISVTYT